MKSVEGLEELKKTAGILDVELFVKPGDRVRPVTVGTDRAGFVITGGRTRDEAYSRAKHAEDSIHIVYEDTS